MLGFGGRLESELGLKGNGMYISETAIDLLIAARVI